MAKEKKRGFFSWLGITGKTQQSADDSVNQQQITDPQTIDNQAISEQDISKPISSEQVPDEQPIEQQANSEATTHPPYLAERSDTEQISLTPSTETADTEPLITESAITETAITASETITQDIIAATTPDVPAITPPGEPSLSEQELSDQPLPEQLPQTQPAASVPTSTAATSDDITDPPPAPQRPGFFSRLKRGLLKTRQNLGAGFISLFRGKKIDDELFEQLEEQLIIADVGTATTSKIIRYLTDSASHKQLKDASALYELLKVKMADILQPADIALTLTNQKPFVILMVGVNGAGKTTTIGKLAHQFRQQGKSVMLAAGDTFRAAAVEQLQVWGQRNNITVVAQHTGADSASVIFDAIQAAQARNIDILIADTAGRLQNKTHLMHELQKIVRVMKKLDDSAPHEIMLTLDASTGQNAVSQTRLFHEAVGLSGITLTKLDGTAKGGIIFSLADQFAIPIRYIGVGEGIDDLRPFSSSDFIDALFSRDSDTDHQEQQQ